MEKWLLHIFERYRILYRKSPAAFATAMACYLALITGMVTYQISRQEAIKERERSLSSENRIKQLESDLDRARTVIDRLSSAASNESFFRDIRFDEEWKTDEARDR